MHNIHHAVYSEYVDKAKVQAYWDEYAAEEDREEGCSGLPNAIRWIDVICKSEEEAQQYIKNHDSGWYDQLAVKFTVGKGTYKEPATVKRLNAQIQSYELKYKEYEKAHSIRSQKAAFVSCPNCQSKINRLKLTSELCPVCKHDMRAEYITKQLQSYREKIKKWRKEINAEIAQRQKDNKPIVKWLVKIEFHT